MTTAIAYSAKEALTAVQAVPREMGEREGQVLTALREIHRSWAQEIRRVLDSARRPEAGIHRRWRAARYLSTIVSPRFEIERSGVETLNQMVEPGHAAQLWLAAELMVTLAWQLDHDLDLCHRAGEFSVLTRKFERAMAHWCGAVEEALGGLTWGDLPEQAQRRFALLAGKEIFAQSGAGDTVGRMSRET